MIWDSVEYCAAALSIASHGTLVTPLAAGSFDGQFDAAGHVIRSHPLVLWPPAYPLLIAAAVKMFSLPVLTGAVLVNAIALAALLFAVWWLTRRATDATTAAAVTMVFGVLPVVQSLFRMVLSESVFLALCGAALVSLVWWMEDPSERVYRSWLAALAIGASINVRFTGAFLVSVHILVATWILLRDTNVRARWPGIVLSVGAGPAIGAAFLIHRAMTISCLFCEPRVISSQSFVANIRALGVALLQSLPAVYELIPGAADTAISLIALVLLLWLAGRGAAGSPDRDARATSPFVLALLFSVIYASGLVFIRTFVEFNSLDTRLASPVCLPLVAVGLTIAFARLQPTRRLPVATLVVAMFVTTSLVSTMRSEAWRGLTDRSLSRTPFVRYAAVHLQNRPGVMVFSNEASLLAAQLRFDGPIYWIGSRGPLLRAGEQGIVMVRNLADGQRTTLDQTARKIVDADGFVVWELPSPSF
jgi:4-amino-4-deoxy-L-arabinose transferase-like glycosyltransferase